MTRIKIHYFWAIATILSIGCLGSCTADQLPEPMEAECDTGPFTYTADIKPIIDVSCAYSGCHLDSSPGRFDSYDGMLPFLETGKIMQRVILQRADPSAGMPPDYAPEGNPRDLTLEQIGMIECWLDAGFPE